MGWSWPLIRGVATHEDIVGLDARIDGLESKLNAGIGLLGAKMRMQFYVLIALIALTMPRQPSPVQGDRTFPLDVTWYRGGFSAEPAWFFVPVER